MILMKTWLAGASFGLAIAAAVYVLVWPMYGAYGPDGTIVKRATLLEVNGAWAFVPVMFPIAIASLASCSKGGGFASAPRL